MSATENRPTRNRAEHRQLWAERLNRFAASGLSVLDFCRSERISSQSFYYWKSKLQHHTADSPDAPPRLFPIHITASAPLEVVLPSGTTLRLSAGCDLALFRCVLDALEGRPC